MGKSAKLASVASSWTTATRPSSPFEGQIGFNSTTNSPEYYSSGSWKGLTKFDYVSTSNPTITTNPSVDNATWLNTSTGAVFVCSNKTTGMNVWNQFNTDAKISPATTFDIFGDNSAVALYQFEGGAGTDTGGLYGMTTNGAISATGKIGTCADFPGSYMKNGNGMNNNLVVSVSAWVNVTDTGNNWIWSSGKYSNGSCRRGVRISNLTLDVCSFSSEYLPGSAFGTITSGAWVNVTVSGDKVYVNGELRGSITSYVNPVSDTYGFYIGANSAYDYGYVTNETYGQPMNGKIDQIRVFNRVLTQAEVTKLYQESSL